jgi:hypothetical protein
MDYFCCGVYELRVPSFTMSTRVYPIIIGSGVSEESKIFAKRNNFRELMAVKSEKHGEIQFYVRTDQ